MHQQYDERIDRARRELDQHDRDEAEKAQPPVRWSRLREMSREEAKGILVGWSSWDLYQLARIANIKQLASRRRDQTITHILDAIDAYQLRQSVPNTEQGQTSG
jgi:hypothetical protein